MIKKYHDDDFWYEITQGPDQGGRMARVYNITCRYCGCVKSFHTGRLSDEKMRKHLIREGWEIGRHTKAHACPGCGYRHKEKPTPPPPTPTRNEDVLITPPPPMVSLEAAWIACSEEEREAFAMKIYEEYFAVIPAHSNGGAQPQPDPTIDDDPDEEPADWWLEIHGANSGATK